MKKKLFLKELSSIFDKKKVDEKDNLMNLGLDSIKVLELIAFKESKFKSIKINPSEYLKCKSISDLIKIFKIKN
jgi:acyl carrier protein